MIAALPLIDRGFSLQGSRLNLASHGSAMWESRLAPGYQYLHLH